MKLLVVVILAAALLILVRRNILQIDMSFPLFAALVVLGFASMSEKFIEWVAARLDILDAPRAIILIAIAILLAIVSFLSVAISRLRYRQVMILRHLAQVDLLHQESSRTTPCPRSGS
jgi:hypothetical protein